MDYITKVFENFYELHGDRCFRDDRALIGGVAMFDGMPVTVLADMRGVGLEDRIKRNFGMPMPDGYRKAVRLMKQAEKFGRPVVTFINTSGAFCGVDAEERGQGEAIAENLVEMMGLRTPVISVIIGEGGSGGALGLAVADRVYMLENAVYSVIAPEGCANILWKDAQRVEEACEALHITAKDMKAFQVAETIIPEDFVHFDMMCENIVLPKIP